MLTAAFCLLSGGVWLTYLTVIAARTMPARRTLVQRAAPDRCVKAYP
jgi:hypothetical protein